MSLIKLGAAVGLVALASAIQSKHAEDDVPDEDAIRETFIRERTAELIAEGFVPEVAHAQAIAELEALYE